MTYRVVIVDDEQVVRSRLKDLLFQARLPLEIVGEYDNGIDAYEGILSTSPDLLIIDVNIPYFDGLEVIRRVKSALPLLKAIVITGFDEFDYAKQSANLNVIGLLSKPITLNDLKLILNKALQTLNKEFALADNMARLQSFYTSNAGIIKENALRRLLKTKNISPNFQQHLKHDKINIDFNYVCLAVFDLDRPYDDINVEIYEYVMSSIKSGIEELNVDGVEFDAFLQYDNVIGIIKSNSVINIGEIQDKFAVILAMIKRTANVSLSVGISDIEKIQFNFAKMFANAKEALSLRTIIGENKVHYYGDRMSLGLEKQDIKLDDNLYKGLTSSLKALNVEEFNEQLKQLKKQVLSDANLEIYYYSLTNVLNAIVKACSSQTQLFERYMQYSKIFEKFMQLKTADDIFDIFTQLANVVVEINREAIDTDISSTYKMIVDYIDANYKNPDLTLEILSENVCLSISYLSSVLKKENTTFVKYLTSLRMEKAKELLLQPNSKIVCVANEVGYSDAYYFSYCFKKYVGMSPKEYRQAQ